MEGKRGLCANWAGLRLPVFIGNVETKISAPWFDGPMDTLQGKMSIKFDSNGTR